MTTSLKGGKRVSTHRIKLIAPSPALVKHAEERAQSIQNRIADWITAYAGSMNFVYLSIALFAIWMTLVEKKPWPTLTLIVSLEAIFLSTFVMISQNRADEKREVLADHQWQTVQQEEQQNEELLHISNQILELTEAIHAMNTGQSDGLANQAGDEVDRSSYDRRAKQEAKQSVREQRASNPAIAHRSVGNLVVHADREGDVGEVAVRGSLRSV